MPLFLLNRIAAQGKRRPNEEREMRRVYEDGERKKTTKKLKADVPAFRGEAELWD
jgi:hypothetical protein